MPSLNLIGYKSIEDMHALFAKDGINHACTEQEQADIKTAYYAGAASALWAIGKFGEPGFRAMVDECRALMQADQAIRRAGLIVPGDENV